MTVVSCSLWADPGHLSVQGLLNHIEVHLHLLTQRKISRRLASMNQISLTALTASNTALHSALKDSVQEVKAWVHSEVTTLVGTAVSTRAKVTSPPPLATNTKLK